MRARVINMRHDRAALNAPDVVRIDRKTRWGNPYVIGRARGCPAHGCLPPPAHALHFRRALYAER